MDIRKTDVEELQAGLAGQMKFVPRATGGVLRLRLVRGYLEVTPLTTRGTIRVVATGNGAATPDTRESK